MNVLFSPQRNDDVLRYEFDGEVITAYLNGERDVFDFSQVPEGKLKAVETTLPINPIVSAERKEGVLYVELLNFIGEDATEEERFPEWQVVNGG